MNERKEIQPCRVTMVMTKEWGKEIYIFLFFLLSLLFPRRVFAARPEERQLSKDRRADVSFSASSPQVVFLFF